MNVLIYNENKDKLLSLNIDVIKRLEGCYSAEELSEKFSGLYFDNVILDITSLKEYYNFDNLQKFANKMKIDSVIILLNEVDSNIDVNVLRNKLISLGFNKITSNINDIEIIVNNS